MNYMPCAFAKILRCQFKTLIYWPITASILRIVGWHVNEDDALPFKKIYKFQQVYRMTQKNVCRLIEHEKI